MADQIGNYWRQVHAFDDEINQPRMQQRFRAGASPSAAQPRSSVQLRGARQIQFELPARRSEYRPAGSKAGGNAPNVGSVRTEMKARPWRSCLDAAAATFPLHQREHSLLDAGAAAGRHTH